MPIGEAVTADPVVGEVRQHLQAALEVSALSCLFRCLSTRSFYSLTHRHGQGLVTLEVRGQELVAAWAQIARHQAEVDLFRQHVEVARAESQAVEARVAEATRKATEAAERAAKEVADIRAAANAQIVEAKTATDARILRVETAADREIRRVKSEARARCRRSERELGEERMACSSFEQKARLLQLESNEQKQRLKDREEELRGECLPKSCCSALCLLPECLVVVGFVAEFDKQVAELQVAELQVDLQSSETKREHLAVEVEIQAREVRELTGDIRAVCDRLGVAQGPEQARRLLLVPGRARELAMEQSGRVAQQMVGVILAHYPNLDKEVVGEGWPPGLADEDYGRFEAEAAPLAERMVTNAAGELGLLDDPAGGGSGDEPPQAHGLLIEGAGDTGADGGAEDPPA
jgi:hypothetical protein